MEQPPPHSRDPNWGPLARKISQTTVNPCVSTAPSAKIPPKSEGLVPICSQPSRPVPATMNRQNVAGNAGQQSVPRVNPSCRPNAPTDHSRAPATPIVEFDRGAMRLQVQRFARRLCRQFPLAFRDAHSVESKETAIRWLRVALPPHPGRPRKASVTLACRLRREGVPWREIYPRCIENLAAFDWRTRRQEIRRLRNAYRARHRLVRRQEGENPPSVSHADKNRSNLAQGANSHRQLVNYALWQSQVRRALCLEAMD
jgi:hypothetical protein